MRKRKPEYFGLENELVIAHIYGCDKIVVLLDGIVLFPLESLVEGEDVFGLHDLKIKVESQMVALRLGRIFSESPGICPNGQGHRLRLLLILLKQICAHFLQIDVFDGVLAHLSVGVDCAVALWQLFAMCNNSYGVGVEAAVHSGLLELAVLQRVPPDNAGYVLGGGLDSDALEVLRRVLLLQNSQELGIRQVDFLGYCRSTSVVFLSRMWNIFSLGSASWANFFPYDLIIASKYYHTTA